MPLLRLLPRVEYRRPRNGSRGLTQSPMIAAIADRAELSKADARRALDPLDEVVLEELGNAQKVRFGGLVELTVRVRPATKKRTRPDPGDGRGDHDRG